MAKKTSSKRSSSTKHSGAKKTPSKKSSSQTKGRGKTEKVMHEYKHGELKSGSGKKVKNRKQAVAIALNEARQSGAKIPKEGSAKKSSSSKKSSSKRSKS